ncbi:MAG TPA: type VI secretion system-associated protein TagF [Polyangia bacterium]|nr:type VI secretion system-associated protein TagF [Polyangia bacterium]
MSGAGLYGKVATQPDFLRAGAGSFSQAGLDRWFQDGMELLRTERTQLPATPTAFLLAPPDAALAFVGVFAPSADAAGRTFPLVVFSEVDAAGLPDMLPSLPAAAAPFLNDAVMLTIAAASADGPTLAAQAQAMKPASLAAGAGAEAWRQQPRSAVLDALGGSPAALAYALRTLQMATDRARAGGAAAGVTVDAPAPTAEAVGLWLEIIRRRLGPRTLPSLIWTEGLEGRLLITIGPLAPAALAFLANPRHRSSKLWPLRTVAAAAADEALRALTPEQRRLVENPGATLGDLAAAFAA